MTRIRHSSPLTHSLGLAGIAVLVALTSTTPADALVPGGVQVQGQLHTKAGGPVTDGVYLVTFRLYAGPNAAKSTWHEVVAALTVKQARFRHTIGQSKPLSPAVLASASPLWLTVQVGNEPEMERVPLAAAPYTLKAASTDSLTCSGCLSMSSLKSDGNLDLGGHDLKAATATASVIQTASVEASVLVGGGSKLTGIKLPAGQCPGGQVMVGVQTNGSLQCGALEAVGDATLAKASGGLLTTASGEQFTSATLPKAIADNNPIGTADVIEVGDIGPAKKLSVSVHLKNSDLSGVEVILYDPEKATYVLHKGGKGTVLKTSYPDQSKPVSGNLDKWIGKNPKGKWRLRVIDTKFLNNKSDGSVIAWTDDVQSAKSKRVTSLGGFIAAGGFQAPMVKPKPSCGAKDDGKMFFNLGDKSLYYCDGSPRKLLVQALCGNGVVNVGETCDDSNTKEGDGCTAKCLKNVCGDGVLWPAEEACDDGNKKR